MIFPDIHDDSQWVPLGTHDRNRVNDSDPLSAHGTPVEYVERSLPSSTDGIDWISPREDHDFMWGYH